MLTSWFIVSLNIVALVYSVTILCTAQTIVNLIQSRLTLHEKDVLTVFLNVLNLDTIFCADPLLRSSIEEECSMKVFQQCFLLVSWWFTVDTKDSDLDMIES